MILRRFPDEVLEPLLQELLDRQPLRSGTYPVLPIAHGGGQLLLDLSTISTETR